MTPAFSPLDSVLHVFQLEFRNPICVTHHVLDTHLYKAYLAPHTCVPCPGLPAWAPTSNRPSPRPRSALLHLHEPHVRSDTQDPSAKMLAYGRTQCSCVRALGCDLALMDPVVRPPPLCAAQVLNRRGRRAGTLRRASSCVRCRWRGTRGWASSSRRCARRWM